MSIKKQIKFGNALDSQGIIVIPADAYDVSSSMQIADSRWPGLIKTYENFCDYTIPSQRLGQIVIHSINTELIIISVVINTVLQKSGKRVLSLEAINDSFYSVAELANNTALNVNYQMFDISKWAVISEIIDNCFDLYPNVCRTLWITDNL